MLTNTPITIYHKTLDLVTRLEKWTRYNYEHCWWFDTKGTSINKGYDHTNNVDVRIPYNLNENARTGIFTIGDIICKGNIQNDITSQSDLDEPYNITSINDNDFGAEPHIHLGGK